MPDDDRPTVEVAVGRARGPAARSTSAVEPADDGARVTVRRPATGSGCSPTSPALFALQRASVRSARAWTQDDVGVSVWEVAEEHLDEAVLRAAVRGDRRRAGSTRPPGSSGDPGRGSSPSVVVRPEASARATVLEVRAADRPGVVHLVCAALARLDLTVRSAHVDHPRPAGGRRLLRAGARAGVLSDTRAAAAAHAVRRGASPRRGLPL